MAIDLTMEQLLHLIDERVEKGKREAIELMKPENIDKIPAELEFGKYTVMAWRRLGHIHNYGVNSKVTYHRSELVKASTNRQCIIIKRPRKNVKI